MPKLRLTKEFRLEMAHALWNYKGKCKNIHGHSYKLQVTVIGEINNSPTSNDYGMVIDFRKINKLIEKNLVEKYDHSLILNKKYKSKGSVISKQMLEKCYFVDFQPTCENLILFFVDIIKKILPKGITLYSVKLWETATSMSEWCIEDNDKNIL